MPSPARPWKLAMEAALRGSADLTAAMGGRTRLYTAVPTDAPLPYGVIGDDQVIPLLGGCAIEAEIISTVNLWSRVSPLDGGDQARAIGAVIVDILGVPLVLDGWTEDEVEIESERYVTDPDQSTHGIITFRRLVTEGAD